MGTFRVRTATYPHLLVAIKTSYDSMLKQKKVQLCMLQYRLFCMPDVKDL